MIDWSQTKEGDTILFEEDSFELYCKIARDCHNAIPLQQFQKNVFKSFELKVTKENIDEIKKNTIYSI